MATKTTSPAPQRAVVDGRYLLNVDDAVQLIGLLAKADIVSYSWGDKSFKYYESGSGDDGIKIKVLTPAEEAMLAMNSDK